MIASQTTAIVAAVDAEHQQRIGDTSHPEPIRRLFFDSSGLLRRRWLVTSITLSSIPDGSVDQFLQGLGIETLQPCCQRMLDQRRWLINQQTRAVGRRGCSPHCPVRMPKQPMWRLFSVKQ